jgi:hypothetical protein
VHSLNKEANEKHNATEVIILNTCFMDKLANKLKLKKKKKKKKKNKTIFFLIQVIGWQNYGFYSDSSTCSKMSSNKKVMHNHHKILHE